MRLLQIENSHGAAAMETHEFHYIFPWLDGVDRIDYDATVPFVKLRYADAGMPLEIELEAWSPFIPRDVKNSSLPAAFFDFKLRSTADRPMDVSLLAVMRNCVGYDVRQKVWTARTVDGNEGRGYRAFELSAEGMDPSHASFGTMGVASMHPDTRYHIGWSHVHQFHERALRARELPDENNIDAGNAPDPENGGRWARYPSFSAIGPTVKLAPGEKLDHRFITTWHFPNRYARVVGDPDSNLGYLEEAMASADISEQPHVEGHYYSNFFENAADVAAYAVENGEMLERETRRFHGAHYGSALPDYVLDQVNSQLNTFRTSSWLTKDGNFGILEGLGPEQSYAGLATTDVAMYGGVATASLFPSLEFASSRAHRALQNARGFVAHSITQNFRATDPREITGHRLDMPAQYAYQTLRVGLWAGDHEFLQDLWPSVKRALDYILRERDANGDLLPDMEGIMCSYDNFPMFGVAPYVATQWLAAISAAVETARVLGDDDALSRYSNVLEKGAAALEKTTWNGRYYRLFANDTGADEGCLADQIIGHWACRLADLPTFLDASHVATALENIMAMNFHPDQGLRNCQWPDDEFLHEVAEDCWVDQANTCWTGVELAFASLLIYEGQIEDGLRVIRSVDDRYRHWGMYWDHQEFGGHYFRPMSAWAIVNAALGFGLRDGVVTFDPKFEGRLLWVTPDGYGHFEQSADTVEIRVLSGELKWREIRVRREGVSEVRLDDRKLEGRTEGDWLVFNPNSTKAGEAAGKLELVS